ncbi:MAG: molecular chaperone TorD family protein [Thermodesulfobacteriota bacterium]|nr:molecular chaperone TorD family protein [Thermodesulfobacteriota bacterium]
MHKRKSFSKDPIAGELAHVYAFLHTLTDFPSDELVTPLTRSFIQSMLAELSHQGLNIPDPFVLCPNLSFSELAQAYTGLFISAVPRVPAPPYASIYRGGDSSLCGRGLVEAEAFYRSAGFYPRCGAEPADHLSCELAFLAHLAAKGAWDMEEDFLKRHFRPWFKAFHDLLGRVNPHPFYSMTMDLINFFTKPEPEESGEIYPVSETGEQHWS